MNYREYLQDVKLHLMSGTRWWKHQVRWLDATAEQLAEANYRTALPDEIVIDVDSLAELEGCREKLSSLAKSYSVWASGGRGFHIHSFWSEMLNMDKETRNRVRKAIVQFCGGCESTTSESHLIGIENRPHRRTGKKKTLIFWIETGKNELPLFALIAAAGEPQRPAGKQVISKEAALQNPFLLYALTHKLPDKTGRKMSVCKNLSFLFVNAGLSDNEISGLIDRLLPNMPGLKRSEFTGWLEWSKGRDVHCNYFELVKWLRENMGVLCDAV